MGFANNSINYSFTEMLKTKILYSLLNEYNNYITQVNNVLNIDVNTGNKKEYYIMNNNKKYYMYITNKNKLEKNSNDKYNIVYMFPDNNSINYFKNIKLENNNVSDFYFEIDSQFTDSFLFEGYLYKQSEKYEYLVTDVLIHNDSIITSEYSTRNVIINEVLRHLKLKNLNNHMSIGIHTVFNPSNQNYIKIFKDNFIYKKELCCIEIVKNNIKERQIQNSNSDKILKKITKSNVSEIYYVFDIITNNKEGILYIKGLKESKKIKELLCNNESINIDCIYNKHFSKWSPVF